MKTLISSVALFAAMSAVAAGGNRWLRYGGFCSKPQDVVRAKAMVDRAAKAGMNGMTVSGLDGLWRWDDAAKGCLRELKAYADAKGVSLIPHGWSVGYGAMTGILPELSETAPFEGMPFVAEGASIVPATDAVALENGALDDFDLAKDTFAGWNADHPGAQAFVDTNVFHSGAASVRFEPRPGKDKYGHARFFRHVTLKPGRRYRFSAWVRGEGVHHAFNPVRLAIIVDGEKTVNGAPTYAKGLPFKESDRDWRKVSVTFLTGEAGGAWLYAGSWRLKEGAFWLDDFSLEEVGVTELSRRATAPRSLRSAATGRIYEEGRDWTLAATKPGEEVRMDIPAGSRIAPGERLLFSGYAVARAGGKGQNSACMSDPRLYEVLEKSAQAIEEELHPAAWFLSIDEVRNGGTCELCSMRQTDMAHIFGGCVTRMRDIIRGVSPNAAIFAWSDMLDPYHNAIANPLGCRGSFVGVADLIPEDVGMMLWSGDALDKSASYFAARKHALMGSICCDAKDAARLKGTLRRWRKTLSPRPELKGYMYTTWLNNYDNIELFMRELK